jgi:multiple sugar transport system permease protein
MESKRQNRIGWLFVAPATLHLVLFALFPIVCAFVMSLYKVQLFKGNWQPVGFKNYSYAFTEPAFLNALGNSLKFALLSVPAGMAVALAVAILVNQKIRGITIFRTIYYIPAVASGIAIAMLWIFMYLPEQGLINTMVRMIGLPDIDYLKRTEWAMPALAFMSIWVGLGPRMVLFLAGLIGIPQPLYESASIDGASSWVCFKKITLPMLIPTTLFVLVTSTISTLQMFTPVYLMTQGGPEGSTDVVGYHIYTEAWVSFNTGLASAKSFILLLVIAAIAWLQFKLLQEREMGGTA